MIPRTCLKLQTKKVFLIFVWQVAINEIPDILATLLI